MKIKILAHTKISNEMEKELVQSGFQENATHGQLVALTAIRTCYSPGVPSNIIINEGQKYFGEGGKEANRLMNHIFTSGHTSTLEHISFTFMLEGVSRSLLAQLTRHRHFSYSVQSQRYVKLESGSRSGGFDYVSPDTVNESDDAIDVYSDFMDAAQATYDKLRKLGIPAEDARYVLPNAATCNLVLTGNLRSLIDFYSKRGEGTHAQKEIKQLAEKMKEAVVKVEPWTKSFFEVI